VRVRTALHARSELVHARKFAAPRAMSSAHVMTTPATVSDVLDEGLVLDDPLAFVWPLAGPFGAVLLSAMAWLSI
jgi:hypothetical protein